MNSIQKVFAQNVLRPFDVFRSKLGKPYIYSAAYSGLGVEMANIANAINHFPEAMHTQDKALEVRKYIAAIEPAFQLIWDFADTSKHSNLRKRDRITDAVVASRFEFSETDGFRFIQTVPYLTKRFSAEAEQKIEFVEAVLAAIKALEKVCEVGVASRNIIAEAEQSFRKVVNLWHAPDNSGEVSIEAINIEFVKIGNDGSLVYVDPPEIRIEILEEQA
jgi:hypothetical protein